MSDDESSGAGPAPRRRHVVLTVNGEEREALVEPRRSLADFLREDLGLTVHAHPTLYEAIYEAASVAAGRPIHG